MNSKLNFFKLMALKPTIYLEFINSIGQKVLLVEHPINGDEYPVIAVFPGKQLAFYTDFFETGEIDEIGGEYEVGVYDNELFHGLTKKN